MDTLVRIIGHVALSKRPNEDFPKQVHNDLIVRDFTDEQVRDLVNKMVTNIVQTGAMVSTIGKEELFRQIKFDKMMVVPLDMFTHFTAMTKTMYVNMPEHVSGGLNAKTSAPVLQ